VVNILERNHLAPFMDYNSAALRIKSLEKHSDLGARATRLAAAFDEGVK
jgi:hypothetical protein